MEKRKELQVALRCLPVNHQSIGVSISIFVIMAQLGREKPSVNPRLQTDKPIRKN
jgi:hypothetical protein